MNKKELAELIAKKLIAARKTDLSIKDVTMVIECFIDVVKEVLIKNDVLRINNFGSFFNKFCASKQGRNLSKGGKIFIPACYKPKWAASKQLTALVRENIKSVEKKK